MRKIRVGLCALAITYLVFLFAPVNALAQDEGDWPCCYFAPPDVSHSSDDVVLSGLRLVKSASESMAINARVPDQAGSSIPARLLPMALASSSKAEEIPAFAESRKLNYGRQS